MEGEGRQWREREGRKDMMDHVDKEGSQDR